MKHFGNELEAIVEVETPARPGPRRWPEVAAILALALSAVSLVLSLQALTVRSEETGRTAPLDGSRRLSDLDRRLVALESRSIRVPLLQGLTLREATNLLGIAELGLSSNDPLDVPLDCVIAEQFVQAGTLVPPQTSVRVTVTANDGQDPAACR